VNAKSPLNKRQPFISAVEFKFLAFSNYGLASLKFSCSAFVIWPAVLTNLVSGQAAFIYE
jgi:hypothetical protein